MSEPNPLVSIVVPVYNCAEWVGFTVDSVLQQTFTHWELILVNDGSTDQSLKVLHELAKKDTRILVVDQPNGKQGRARNNGISRAKGEWIAFLDADDLWPDFKLERQLQLSIQHNVDLSFTDGFICIGNQMDLRTYRFGVTQRVYQGNSAVQEFHAQNRIPTSTVMARKSCFEKYGGFPEEPEIQNCEDYLLWTRLLHNGATFLSIDQPWLFYRVHENSSTGQEVKGLIPLVQALWRIDGEKGSARRNHLEQVFRKLIVCLAETNDIQKLAPLVSRSMQILRPGVLGWIMGKTWHVSPRVFISLFWRTSPIKN